MPDQTRYADLEALKIFKEEYDIKIDEKLNEKINISQGSENAGKILTIDDSGNIIPGNPEVQKATHSSTADTATNAENAVNAEHATSADTATTANSAIKAEQDGNGNVIADTYETKTDAQTKYDEVIAYADQVKSDILGGAPKETLDTIMELATAFEENAEVVDALNEAIVNKADVGHVHSWEQLEDKPFYKEVKVIKHVTHNLTTQTGDFILADESMPMYMYVGDRIDESIKSIDDIKFNLTLNTKDTSLTFTESDCTITPDEYNPDKQFNIIAVNADQTIGCQFVLISGGMEADGVVTADNCAILFIPVGNISSLDIEFIGVTYTKIPGEFLDTSELEKDINDRMNKERVESGIPTIEATLGSDGVYTATTDLFDPENLPDGFIFRVNVNGENDHMSPRLSINGDSIQKVISPPYYIDGTVTNDVCGWFKGTVILMRNGLAFQAIATNDSNPVTTSTTGYGYCVNSASDTIKTIQGIRGFELRSGSILNVTFDNGNTADKIMLHIPNMPNNVQNKVIFLDGVLPTDITPDRMYTFVYVRYNDSNVWLLTSVYPPLNANPDWNQNDETASDYVKNRPFYEENTNALICEHTCSGLRETDTIIVSGFGAFGDYEDRGWNIGYLPEAEYIFGDEYTVYINGVSYKSTLKKCYTDTNGWYAIGLGISEEDVFDIPKADGNVPFICYLSGVESPVDGAFYKGEMHFYLRQETETFPDTTIQIYHGESKIHYLDPKYIKDMYYESTAETVIVEETTITLEEGAEPIGMLTATQPLKVGQEYIITLDGITYNCVCKEDSGMPYIGNIGFVGADEDTEEPFFIAPIESPIDLNLGIIINSDTLEHIVNIVSNISEIHHIDPKYIKDMYYENTEYILKTSSDIDEILTNMGYDPFAGTRSPKKVNGLTFSVAVDGVIYDDVTVYIDGYIAGCNTYIIGDRCVTSPDGIRWDTTDYGFAYSRYGTQYNSDIFPNGIEKIEVYELKRDLKQLDMKYLPIMEEVSNTVVEIDEIESGLEIADPSYKKLVGKYKVTVDGEFEIVKFIGDDVESFYECDSYLIGTWDGGIYFEYFSENENPHSLKIEKVKNVVKEEHLPDSVKTHDWNTLENKPFYDDREITTKITLIKTENSDNYVFTDTSDNYDILDTFRGMIEESEASNSIITVEINSVLYEMYPHYYSGVYYLGFNESGVTSDWVIYNNMAGNNGLKIILSIGTSNNYSSGISVSGDSVDITFYTKYSLKQLDEKYIPNSIKESIGKKAGLKVEGTVYTIDGEEITASIGAEIFNDYENNIATGTYSSAKGHKTVALGTSSYAEGRDTKAISAITHAEGYGTIASGLHQHVQGEYNIEDTEDKYAHIVGNGTADSARSNAHTLDWQGNAWYQGSVEATAIILKSPNGTRFSITVGDDGVLSATEVTE